MIKVYAHKCFGGRQAVPAMVSKSGESVAWLAKLCRLQHYGMPLPTLSFVHYTAEIAASKGTDAKSGLQHAAAYSSRACTITCYDSSFQQQLHNNWKIQGLTPALNSRVRQPEAQKVLSCPEQC